MKKIRKWLIKKLGRLPIFDLSLITQQEILVYFYSKKIEDIENKKL